MTLGMITFHLVLPGCKSLKEKRSRLSGLKIQLRKKFNLSVAELDSLDIWDQAIIGCALISNSHLHTDKSIGKIIEWVNNNWHHGYVSKESVEILN